MTHGPLIELLFALKQADVTDSNFHMKNRRESEAAFRQHQHFQLVFLSNPLKERKQD